VYIYPKHPPLPSSSLLSFDDQRVKKKSQSFNVSFWNLKTKIVYNVGKEVLHCSDWSVATFSSAENRVLGIEMFGDDVDRCDSVGVEKDT
jgi:hypothetical protein